MIRKSGKSFSTISAEPSMELLSTISASIRSPFASRCTSSRQARKSSLVLNDTTTTEASYALFSAGSKGGSQLNGEVYSRLDIHRDHSAQCIALRSASTGIFEGKDPSVTGEGRLTITQKQPAVAPRFSSLSL